MDHQSVTQQRRSSRSNVMLKASLERPGGSVSVVLRNLSQDGALVKGEHLPDAGERVLFARQGLCVPSRVAWVHKGHAGICFDSPLFPKELLRHIPAPSGRPAPEIMRRPGLAPRPLSPSERSLIETWAAASQLPELH